MTRTRISRFPGAFPLFSGLGTHSEFGITQQYPPLAPGRENKAGGSPMRLSLKFRAERLGDRWAGAGPDGTFLRREGAHSCLSQPHLPLGPPEPVGRWGGSGCSGSRWMIYFVPRCSSLEARLLLPGKAVGSSVEVPPAWLPGWGRWQGGALLPHVGWGLLGEAAGWIRSQGGSLASSQGT